MDCTVFLFFQKSITSNCVQLQSPSNRPNFASVLDISMATVATPTFVMNIHDFNSPVRLVIEGLMAHFFAPERLSYVPEDVKCFLKSANKQTQWCYLSPQEDNSTEEEHVQQEVCVCSSKSILTINIIAGNFSSRSSRNEHVQGLPESNSS